MSINYLIIPVEKYGSFKVEIEPIKNEIIFEELGINYNDLFPSDNVEDLSSKDKVQTVILEAKNAFNKINETIDTIIYGFQDHINKLEDKLRPDEASIEFGITFKAEAGIVVARAASDASFKIILKWNTQSNS